MSSSVTTPAQVVNIALGRINPSKRIGSLYDGSPWARAALTIYGQTRDALIRNGDWQFAERLVSGVLLKTAPPIGYFDNPWTPAYPAPPWLFQYAYPDDCLDVRSVRHASTFLPNFNPIFNRFSVENDKSYPTPVKVVLCDVPSALITYAGQVTDPSTWEPDFVEAMAAALARRLAPIKDHSLVSLEAADEQAAFGTAINNKG